MINRRSFLSLSAGTALSMASGKAWGLASIPMPPATNNIEQKLDTFTAVYMRAMNAPGMTQALTDTDATIRTAAYGYSNVDLKAPVTTELLFQIGSITKSFVAVVLLQLHDEGKVDLNRPVLEYLPWLPITTPHGPITAHHLLTHTAGLPDASGLFQSDPAARHVQGFTPGEHFHYCNLGFAILGQLIQHLDGRPWHECVKARILTPLGMMATAPVITIASSARSAVGYQPFYDDQTYPRQGRLTAAAPEVFDSPAGSIAAPPADMATYLRMLLNGGRGPQGRIVSQAGFTLMTTPYIKALEFSPTASYGYGIAVDTLDGHKVLRHTGGMNCFASSIHIDLDGGYAAFASINAMQGYRPTAVTQYAVQLLRAERAKPLPEPEPLRDPLDVDNAHEYAGTFHSFDSKQINFKADGRKLFLVNGDQEILLQRSEGDTFVSTVPGVFADYSVVFTRDLSDNKASSPPVAEVSYGPDWFINASYKGDHAFRSQDSYSALIGHYRSADGNDARVFVRKGKLWLGDAPLTEIGSSLFRIGEDVWSPDTAQFLTIVEGKARLLRVIDDDCWRIEVG